MAWTTPKTDWATGNLVAASNMNDIGNNLAFLKSPPTALYKANEAADYQTTSTSFVNVDGTNFSLTIVTAGGPVLVGFFGNVAASGGTPNINFDVEVDGTRQGGDDGYVCQIGGTGEETVSFVIPLTGLAAGSHTFRLQWKTSANTAILRAGAGSSSGRDNHPVFWVKEA